MLRSRLEFKLGGGLHNKGHNRLSATSTIQSSENHSVGLVYLMSGTKGFIYHSPLNKKLCTCTSTSLQKIVQ